MGPMQVELDELIRRLNAGDDRLRTLGGRVASLRQGVRELWMFGARSGGFTPATITGKIIGCSVSQVATPDSFLRLTGHQTGTDYGLWPVPTGTYSITYFRDPADTSIDGVATHSSPRFGTGPVTSLFTSGPQPNIPLAPAAGYYCCPGLCNYPLASVINVQDSRLGADVITHGAGGATGFFTGLSPTAWTSGVGANPMHALDDTAIARWGGKSGALIAFPNFPNPATCPDLAGTKFDITYTWGSNQGPYFTGDTVRFFEP